MIETTINGQHVRWQAAHPDESVVDLLRRHGLTGTKLVCGTGVCGACTILVDGAPVAACLLPVQQLAGREVQTVEFHNAGNLHPVQLAFMQHDALQCGFCTPGLINSSIAFFEQWRANKGTETPTRSAIASALAGHLCRCGAYEGIYRALAAACAGEFDHGGEVTSPRYEALDKVTGRARYTVDHHRQGQLEGAILRALHPHATVQNVDPSAALDRPGVHAYVDLLGSERIVRYVGQPIGAVAAVDTRAADAALAKIRVDYDVHPAAVGPQAARSAGAPLVFPDPDDNVPSAAEFMTFRGSWQGNVHRSAKTPTAADADTARTELRQASPPSRRLDGHFANAVQAHTPLEPHACLARWDDPHHLTIHLSTQSIRWSVGAIAERFDLEEKNVTLTAQHVGGAFGSKHGIDVEAVAAIKLARATGRPVRVCLTSLEEISYAGLRPGAEVQISLVTDGEGRPRALSATTHNDSGAAIGGGVGLMLGGYAPDIPRHLEEYDVANHSPPGKPFRGPGGPQALWAWEQTLDEAAALVGADPITLRKAWYPDDPLRHRLLDWASALPIWQERVQGRRRGRFRSGVGLAVATWPFYHEANTELLVGSSPAGFSVRTTTQDPGTGTRTLLARAVADLFGVPWATIRVEVGQSGPNHGPGSAGSMVSNSVYGPATAAARQLREQLLAAAASEAGLREVTAVAGGIRHADGFLPWEDLLLRTDPIAVTATRGDDSPAGARSHAVAVVVTHLHVDTRFGKVQPQGVWQGIAAGRIFLPTLARSQVQGGIIQGLGYGLYEERLLDPESGLNLAATLEEYKIPGIGDVPPLEIYFLEEGFADVPGGGIGIAELSTVGVAASVGNAVFNATGWRPRKTPIKPRDLLEGVRP